MGDQVNGTSPDLLEHLGADRTRHFRKNKVMNQCKAQKEQLRENIQSEKVRRMLTGREFLRLTIPLAVQG